MLKQALEYRKLQDDDSYKEYIECLHALKKPKRGVNPVDFTKEYFDSAEGSRRIFFPKYKVIADNPFIPIVFGNDSCVVIETLPLIQVLDNLETKVTKVKKVRTKKANTQGNARPSEKLGKQDDNGDKEKMPRHIFEAMKSQIPFITNIECKSSKRSDPHHISKTALIEVITKNKHFAQYFPKGYRNMSKEKLCDVIFNV